MPRKTDTRERLIDAAIAVLERDGEVAIRVGELAEAVNVTKPSVYHFFGDREGLVVAALAEMYRRALEYGRDALLEVAQAATTREEFEEAFLGTVTSFGSDDGARRRALRVEVLGAAVSRPQLQRAIDQMHRQQMDFVVNILSIGKQRGFVNAPFDLQTAALWASALILSRHFGETDSVADLAEWDTLTREAFRHLLFDDIRRD